MVALQRVEEHENLQNRWKHQKQKTTWEKSYLVEGLWSETRLVPDTHYLLPYTFSQLLLEIENSKSILDWEDDWDGEGSPAYKFTTWERTSKFLVQNTFILWNEQGLSMKVPMITAGPEGSIDIHWKLDDRELLINIPSETDKNAGYYGDNQKGTIVKGDLNTTESITWLLMWLIK